MIEIAPGIRLDEEEIEERFIRSSGPGGQNVNKVSSAVELRFDVRRSACLPDAVRDRLEALAGRRVNQDGVLIIKAYAYRTQEANRRDALARLVALLEQAAQRPKTRRPTRPTLASKTRRLDAKAKRSAVKAMRGPRLGQD
ncbi:MAG: alternative ribosome rescue aminoacyl-tRNA hydrolase ArfB [Rhodospirillaceae bacterium]|nr:alternative ribosome rescue aminoacyl-tRNA hydrolase ArfB [Rhodospirillaceae bacterium]